MRPHGIQQWRPKAKAHCVPDAGPVVEVLKNAPVLDHATTVVEESETIVENKVSSSLEVNEVLVQSMKKQRGRLKRKIEAETKTSLSISKQKTGYCIVVEGATDASVNQATVRLQDLLEKADTKAQEKAGSVVDPVRTSGAVKTSLKVQSLQWMPKAVKSLHTSAAEENPKESSHAEEKNDAEIVSGAIEVDKKLLRLIKGHKNEVKQRIEKDTNTTIRIGSPVVVEGSSEECVQEALDEIQRIIEEGVNDSKFQYSHFISLPLSIHPSLVKQLEDFQESVFTALEIPDTEGDQEQPEQATVSASLTVPVDSATAMEAQKDDEVLDQADSATCDCQVGDILFKKTVLTSLGVVQPEEAVENSVLVSVQVDRANVHEKACMVESEAVSDSGNAEPDEVKDSELMKLEEPVQAVVENPKGNVNDVDDGSKDGPAAEDKLTEEETKEYEPLADVSFKTKKTGNSGIERSIFIKPTRFHLTVLMLKLWNDERVEKAREVLKACLPKVIEALDGKPVSVSLTGLEIMRGNPKSTRVLYAKVTDSDGGNRISRACQALIDAFVESGLVLGKDQDQALKLHATVMNTSHRRSKSKNKNKGFDATEILARFGNEGWGDYQILEAHLSERFKYDENDYYHCCASIPFPQTE